MEALDLIIQNNASSGVKPLITLAIFSILGSFFIAAFITSVKRGIKEEGWFKFKIENGERK